MTRKPPPSGAAANPVRSPRLAFPEASILPCQVRAARGLVGCSASELAWRADLMLDDLLFFENHGRLGPVPGRLRIEAALAEMGVLLVPVDHTQGRGVRYAAPRTPADLGPLRADQVRAARGLLWWWRWDLAKRSKVALDRLAMFERTGGGLSPAEQGRVRAALLAGGARLITANGVQGPGARLVTVRPSELLIMAPVAAGRAWE